MARCHLLAKGSDRAGIFLPKLTCFIEDGLVPFTALLTMSLLEVSPRAEHMASFLSSALFWPRRQPDNTLLWVDGSLGGRLARCLVKITAIDSSVRLD